MLLPYFTIFCPILLSYSIPMALFHICTYSFYQLPEVRGTFRGVNNNTVEEEFGVPLQECQFSLSLLLFTILPLSLCPIGMVLLPVCFVHFPLPIPSFFHKFIGQPGAAEIAENQYRGENEGGQHKKQ
jgi:hypothetical protein